MRLFALSYFAYFIQPFSHFSRYLEAKDAKYFREVSLHKSLITTFLKMKWQPYNTAPFADFSVHSFLGLSFFQMLCLQQLLSHTDSVLVNTIWSITHITALRGNKYFLKAPKCLVQEKCCPIHNIHKDRREAR